MGTAAPLNFIIFTLPAKITFSPTQTPVQILEIPLPQPDHCIRPCIDTYIHAWNSYWLPYCPHSAWLALLIVPQETAFTAFIYVYPAWSQRSKSQTKEKLGSLGRQKILLSLKFNKPFILKRKSRKQ